jgi:hypothetical protein
MAPKPKSSGSSSAIPSLTAMPTCGAFGECPGYLCVALGISLFDKLINMMKGNFLGLCYSVPKCPIIFRTITILQKNYKAHL